MFTDFGTGWFDSCSDTIIGAMKFNTWFPIANEIGWFGLRSLIRAKDFCCTSPETNPGNTRSITI